MLVLPHTRRRFNQDVDFKRYFDRQSIQNRGGITPLAPGSERGLTEPRMPSDQGERRSLFRPPQSSRRRSQLPLWSYAAARLASRISTSAGHGLRRLRGLLPQRAEVGFASHLPCQDEIHFESQCDFHRLVIQDSRPIAPLTDRVESGCHQQWMPTYYSSVPHNPITGDNRFDLHNTLSANLLGQRWVSGSNIVDKFRGPDFAAHSHWTRGNRRRFRFWNWRGSRHGLFYDDGVITDGPGTRNPAGDGRPCRDPITGRKVVRIIREIGHRCIVASLHRREHKNPTLRRRHTSRLLLRRLRIHQLNRLPKRRRSPQRQKGQFFNVPKRVSYGKRRRHHLQDDRQRYGVRPRRTSGVINQRCFEHIGVFSNSCAARHQRPGKGSRSLDRHHFLLFGVCGRVKLRHGRVGQFLNVG